MREPEDGDPLRAITPDDLPFGHDVHLFGQCFGVGEPAVYHHPPVGGQLLRYRGGHFSRGAAGLLCVDRVLYRSGEGADRDEQDHPKCPDCRRPAV